MTGLLLGVVGCGGPLDQSPGAEFRPNVVLIIIDTLRAGSLGVYGMDRATSPEIDALAEDGVVFEKAVTQCTWTRPAVGSMLTGLYPRQLGLFTEGPEMLPHRATTLAETLQAAGYTTIGATANPHLNSFYNFQQGFDQYLDSNVGFDWMPQTVAGRTRGEGDAALAKARDLFDHLADQAALSTEGPFYLQVNVMEVHEFWDMEVRYGPEFDQLFEEVSSPAVRRYLQAVRATSAAVLGFVERLASQPRFENTIFVITSDHGESFGEHTDLAPPTWHGFLVYESQAWVPLVFYSTGDLVPRGVRVPVPVRLVDVMPTVLELAGLSPPAGIPGRSLVPLMEDPKAKIGLPRAVVVETRFRDSNKIAAYTDKWKYIVHRDEHRGTLPTELQEWGRTENGAKTDRSRDNPSVSTRLAEWLARWESEVPEAVPEMQERELSIEEREQLRALGYLE